MSLDPATLSFVCVAGGIGLSLAHHGILWLGIVQGIIRQRWGVVAVLAILRLVAIAGCFWGVTRLGAAPALALLAGFLMGRGIALRWVRGEL